MYMNIIYFSFEISWLMEADQSLPGWGGRSAPPPTANGGRAFPGWNSLPFA